MGYGPDAALLLKCLLSGLEPRVQGAGGPHHDRRERAEQRGGLGLRDAQGERREGELDHGQLRPLEPARGTEEDAKVDVGAAATIDGAQQPLVGWEGGRRVTELGVGLHVDQHLAQQAPHRADGVHVRRNRGSTGRRRWGIGRRRGGASANDARRAHCHRVAVHAQLLQVNVERLDVRSIRLSGGGRRGLLSVWRVLDRKAPKHQAQSARYLGLVAKVLVSQVRVSYVEARTEHTDELAHPLPEYGHQPPHDVAGRAGPFLRLPRLLRLLAGYLSQAMCKPGCELIHVALLDLTQHLGTGHLASDKQRREALHMYLPARDASGHGYVGDSAWICA